MNVKIYSNMMILRNHDFPILFNNKSYICQFYFHGPCFAGSTWPQLSGARFQHRTWPNRLMFEPVNSFCLDQAECHSAKILCASHTLSHLIGLPLHDDSLTGNVMHKSSFEFYFV